MSFWDWIGRPQGREGRGRGAMTQYKPNPLTSPNARRFLLVREDDETGLSGIGAVAEGVQFANGWCALSWLTGMHSVGIYPNITQLEGIHGHGGKTRVEWLDANGVAR